MMLSVPLATGFTRELAEQLDDGKCVMLNQLSMAERELFAHVYHAPSGGRGGGLRAAHLQNAALAALRSKSELSKQRLRRASKSAFLQRTQ